MRKPKGTLLWMLTFTLFAPLAAMAADGEAPPVDLSKLPPSVLEQAVREADAAQAAEDLKKATAALRSADPAVRAAAIEAARQQMETNRAAARAQATAREAALAAEKAEREKPKPASTIGTDVSSWDGLKKLIPDVKLVYDRASGDKDYASSVHLEGWIPRDCADLVGGGEFISKYDGSQSIDSLKKLDIPFRGWRFKTSDAAKACVEKFRKDRDERKSSGYCRTDKFPEGRECLSLRDVTRIDNLEGGPKVGFFSCEGDESDCKVAFYAGGKSASDVKRVADSDTYDKARRRIDSSLKTRKTNLILWKIKNVDQCYGTGKKKSLADFFDDVDAIKDKLKDKDELNPFIKRGLNNEIARLRKLAETKKISELQSFSADVVAFYNKYLASSRTDVPNPDLDLMRRATIELFRKMERRVLEDEGALKDPEGAKSIAKAIVSAGLEVAPDDLVLKNELDRGIDIDVTVMKLHRKQVAFEKLKAACTSAPAECDWQRLYAMDLSIRQAQVKGVQYYEKLRLSAYKTCASGRKRSKDPFDDDTLVVDAIDDDEDGVTFNSRCDAAKDNLNRVWRRVQESRTAVQSAVGHDASVVAQLARSITGANSLPNATITSGSNGYNPALNAGLHLPGNEDLLKRLAPQLVPSTALGTGQMCLTGTGGSVSNCVNTSGDLMLKGTNQPAALPVRL